MGIIQFSVFLRNTQKKPNPQLIIMNMFVATLALVALSSVADATIVLGTVATTATTTTLTSASLASLGILGGVAILKGILIAGLAARSKRSAESNDEAAFAILTNAEPAQ